MQVAEQKLSEGDESSTGGLGETAVVFAARLARDDFPSADLAELRRMRPNGVPGAAFWRLTAQHELLGNVAMERRWALILHGIAAMTQTDNLGTAIRSAHNGRVPVGKALYVGGHPRRSTGFYSESRLGRLLIARGPALRSQLARIFRMAGSEGVQFNWREMATFILNEGRDEGAAESSRRYIAREYYKAKHMYAGGHRPISVEHANT